MAPGSPLLALRLGDERHALEPGRTYLLGSSDDCDLRIAGAEPRHARLTVSEDGAVLEDLGTSEGLTLNELRVVQAKLGPGDRVGLCGELLVVVADDGTATLVPVPELRRAARARRLAEVRVAAAALRHEDRAFADLVAQELRRAPWLALSLALHVLLIALVILFAPRREIGGRSLARVAFDLPADAPAGEGPPSPPEVTAEPARDDVLDDFELTEPEPPTPPAQGPKPRVDQPRENPKLAERRRPSTLGDGRAVVRPEEGTGSGSFAKQVAELQESGLEIVFVFDSTGSMTRTILATKRTIVEMLDVLRTLVPDARVGLVTYRDRDRREEYLVRQVPLDLDYWRASNFVQFVVAEGGGDRPEDVRAGLRAAFEQRWRPGARRVVVLAGDAPPHPEDVNGLLAEVRQFARDRRSFVHTLIANPDRAGPDTHTQFARIARFGHGVSEPLANHERVLQRVLTLAFGREFDQDIEAVLAQVGSERERVDAQSLHLARRGGAELARALKQRPVPAALWNALVQRPRHAAADTLIDLLADGDTPLHTRHAAAAALQRILDLPVPPIDVATGEPPTPGRIARLRERATELPR